MCKIGLIEATKLEKEKDSEHIYIPKFLLELKECDSILIYSLMLNYQSENIYLCLEDLSVMLNISLETTYKKIKVLEENKLIRELSDFEKYEMLIAKKNFVGFGKNKCEWCGAMTTCLHEHHYPIKKSAGGIDTVNICPTCHSEFHNKLYVVNVGCK